MFLRAGNAGLKRKSKKVSFQQPKERKGKLQFLKEGKWECPRSGPSARIAEMILHIGGCGSFAPLMRAKSGSSGARNAGRPGENITRDR